MKFKTRVRLFMLLCLVKVAEQSCKSIIKNKPQCDSFGDINLGQTDWVGITTNNLEPLDVIENGNNIKRLQIDGSINGIKEGAFTKMPKLEQLVLSSNKLEVIPQGVFNNLNLKQIYLNENRIAKIEAGAFENDNNLRKLSFRYNNIKRLQPETFNNLNLEQLTLSHNKISTLNKNDLGVLPALTVLHLDNNRLTTFLSDSLSHPQRLEILWLHNNSINVLFSYMFQELKSLKLLNLGSNGITMIEPRTFEKIPLINNLILFNNSITHLTGAEFTNTGMHHLEKLYINYNKLMYLSSDMLVRLPRLKLVTIGGNPWECSCLDLLLKIFKQHKVTVKCDDVYFEGMRPVCIGNSTHCDYNYDRNLSDLFVKSLREYPRDKKWCLL
ncbi:leucine-rich repeat-containing protein 15-like [Aethina tumida]|uniref:leucine-rich repeat-containing protein 15-like n=1 Tax=Aethina tumida TaxID=116153 RepID=UPI0021478F00|nr:leucine-rich repeat-containing protein 15-like [Aethina tumida]